MATNNYTLGRGELHFGQYLPNTQTPQGERYLGNTPELGFTAEQEELSHYSSDRGVRIKDESVLLQLDYSGTFITDNISPENLALFFLGESLTSTLSQATGETEEFEKVARGLTYQLGVSDSTPSGVRKVANVVVEISGGATLVAGTDYVVDADLGRLTLLEGSSSIVDGTTDIEVTYDIVANSRSVVISRSMTIEGSLRFIAHNPAGQNLDYFMPWVKITPNGDFQLKGDDWQALSFNLEILKKGSLESVYIDGRPYTTP